MKTRSIFLSISLLIAVVSITIIMLKGEPQDIVSFDSVFRVGESILHHADKTGRIITEVSDEEEIEVGNKMHSRIMRHYTVRKCRNAPEYKYVNEVGKIVARNVKRKEIVYKFQVIHSDSPNAFSIPGGHVYVTTGLLKKLESESELAAILGHEITHVDAKHCIGAIQYKIATEKVLGSGMDTFVNIGYGIFLRPGYSEVQESEADQGGVYLTYRVGYHPLAMVSAFENMMKAGLSEKRRRDSVTPIGETAKAAIKIIGRYFDSHPSALSRIERIKRYVARKRMINEKSRFYVGKKNYMERKSFRQKRYKEEYSLEI